MKYLYIVNPPARPGYTTERHLSGGIGVSRKLKFWEKDHLILPAQDMLLAAAVGEQAGLKTQVFDHVLDRLYDEVAVENTVSRILSEGAEAESWIGVRISIPTLPRDLAFSNAVKARLPKARVFLFGAVIMATLDHWVGETKADAVIYGEVEGVIGAMFAAEGDGWKQVRGVIDPRTYVPLKGDLLYDGSMQAHFKNWALAKNLTELPYPAYHLLSLERYSPTGKIEDVIVWVTASRGCPIGCTMCPYMLHEGRPLRMTATERVVEELLWLNEKYGIYKVRFRDPNFGFNRKQMRELLHLMIERKVKLSATVELSLEVVDDDLMELMAKAGITTITTGVETADEECMTSIGQKIKINEGLTKKIALADSKGIHVYGTFVVGAPEETWDSVKRTIEYAKHMACECAFTVMTPFPGTPMYFRAIQEGLLDKEMTYEKWNSYTATVRSKHLTADDLSLARLWARLELVIPYRIKWASKFGGSEILKTRIKMIPRQIALVVVRAMVAYRRRRGSTIVESTGSTARRGEKISLKAVGE